MKLSLKIPTTLIWLNKFIIYKFKKNYKLCTNILWVLKKSLRGIFMKKKDHDNDLKVVIGAFVGFTLVFIVLFI